MRRVVCDRCAEPYEPARVEDVEAQAKPGLRDRFSWPERLSWRWVSLAVAAVAVLGALYAVQGGDDEPTPAVATDTATPAPDPPADKARAPQTPKDAVLISESTFQLALPPGWERIAPSGGATFAAVAPGGEADVMLWIERDPKLDFLTFEARSLAQLESLAGSAGAVERNPGPTPETTTSVLAPTSAPNDAPNYEVLISGGPSDYWYYLATTSQPGAGADTTAAVELIQGSFLPQGAGR